MLPLRSNQGRVGTYQSLSDEEPNYAKAPTGGPCPYPKLKRPSGHVARRAFLRGCLAGLSLFKRGQPAKKGLGVTSEKLEKDLGKDKTGGPGAFRLMVESPCQMDMGAVRHAAQRQTIFCMCFSISKQGRTLFDVWLLTMTNRFTILKGECCT